MYMKEYVFEILVKDRVVYATRPSRIETAISKLLDKLTSMNTMCCLDNCYFEETKFLITSETFKKRFVVKIEIPPTILRVRKITKGDIDEEMFLTTLYKIKRRFYEGN